MWWGRLEQGETCCGREESLPTSGGSGMGEGRKQPAGETEEVRMEEARGDQEALPVSSVSPLISSANLVFLAS